MAVKKKGLGRGIDSLIPQTDAGNKRGCKGSKGSCFG